MAKGMLQFLAIMLIVQLFYSISITAIIYAMPVDVRDSSKAFSNGILDADATSTQLQNAMTSQTNIPVLDIGALVYYSGNVVIDLLFNFLGGVPAMFTLIVNGMMTIFSIDTQLMYFLQAFFTVAWSIFYILSLISFITSLRGGVNVA